jgi:hypothetical protein
MAFPLFLKIDRAWSFETDSVPRDPRPRQGWRLRLEQLDFLRIVRRMQVEINVSSFEGGAFTRSLSASSKAYLDKTSQTSEAP